MKVLLSLLLTLTIGTQAQTLAPPDTASFVITAKQTREKLATASATWKITLSRSSGSKLIVKVTQAPPLRFVVIKVVAANGEEFDAARLIETPTTWYADQDSGYTKNRPYETEFDSPLITYAHAVDNLRFVSTDDAKRLSRFTAWDGNIARFGIMPEDPTIHREVIAKYEALSKSNPEAAANPVAKQAVALARNTLEHGDPVGIDSKLGFFSEYDSATYSVRISDFHFLDQRPALDKHLGDVKWKDLTDDPTTAKPEDLALIAHSNSWQPGDPAMGADCALIDLMAGRVRRVPFTGVAAVPGCFVRQRSAIVISGSKPDQVGSHLYEIELKTGINRRLGDKTLEFGETTNPALSPDGKTLAARFSSAKSTSISDCQIVLIDLASGETRMIGKPLDCASVNWLPDGKGLIMVKRDYVNRGKPTIDVNFNVCRMDLDGAITPLFKGTLPLIVEGGVLFTSPDDKKWRLCDLDGKNPRLVGNGLASYQTPSPSPDGKRVLMVDPNQPTGPRPVIVDLATGKSEFVTAGAGLWMLPAWR